MCGKDTTLPLAIHYECRKLPKFELDKYVRNRAKKYTCASCCEKDNKLSNIMNSLPTENCDYNNVLYLVKLELETFKSTTLSSLESPFIATIEKCNKNEYLYDITDTYSKMLKVTESQNNVIKNLKMQTEHTDLEKDEKITDLEIENAVLRQDKGTVKIGDETMGRKVESLTKERNELHDSNEALREQERLLASRKRSCLEEDYKYKLHIEPQKLSSDITSLHEKISSLENVIELEKQILDNYRERTAELESRSSSLEKSLNSAKDKNYFIKNPHRLDVF